MTTLSTVDHLVQRHQTAVVTTSPEYRKNCEEWQELIATLRERLREATNEGKPKHIALHRNRGQLSGTFLLLFFNFSIHADAGSFLCLPHTTTARERVELVLDEDSPFLELCPLAGYDQEDMTLGGSIVSGIGVVR